MLRIILAATALAVMTQAAAAQDRRIDQAAAAIVAAKIGEIRGGFDFDEMPQFVTPVDWHRSVWNGAVDPQPVATISAGGAHPAGAI